MKTSVEIDMSDLEGALREAQSEVRFGAVRAVAQGAREGLSFALGRRRYRDRTWRLTRTAVARLLVASGTTPEAEIEWPMHYAQRVDEIRGFAGDAYLKAERVAEREVEDGISRAQAILAR